MERGHPGRTSSAKRSTLCGLEARAPYGYRAGAGKSHVVVASKKRPNMLQ